MFDVPPKAPKETRQLSSKNANRLGRFEMPKTLVKDEATATDTYAKFVAEPFEAVTVVHWVIGCAARFFPRWKGLRLPLSASTALLTIHQSPWDDGRRGGYYP